MTWNELIYRLNEIPVERREEPALFGQNDGDQGHREVYHIDDLDKAKIEDVEDAVNLDEDEVGPKVFILTP